MDVVSELTYVYDEIVFLISWGRGILIGAGISMILLLFVLVRISWRLCVLADSQAIMQTELKELKRMLDGTDKGEFEDEQHTGQCRRGV